MGSVSIKPSSVLTLAWSNLKQVVEHHIGNPVLSLCSEKVMPKTIVLSMLALKLFSASIGNYDTCDDRSTRLIDFDLADLIQYIFTIGALNLLELYSFACKQYDQTVTAD